MPKSITIQSKPSLSESSNYRFLRQKGLEYIQNLGSKLWTDYNIHDPGITILEALCYALTDLGYRTSLDIKDLLAEKSPGTADADGQFPEDKRQAFFTAREILTVNPWTIEDYRKLLINVDGIKNGWLRCNATPCDAIPIYANCAESILQYEQNNHPVTIKGLYDVLVEFEDADKSGNLNSGKIKYNFGFMNGIRRVSAAIEMRLPSWAAINDERDKYRSFFNSGSFITKVVVQFISANKMDQVDIPSSPETVLDNALRKPVFATIAVTFKPEKNIQSEQIVFEDVPVTVWFRSIEDRRALELPDLKKAIEDITEAGILPKYLEKLRDADAIIQSTKAVLHRNRNLAEDFCSVKAIEVEDIAVCMDLELSPSSDKEAVIGEAYYRIDQYFSPDIRFYSLKQLLDGNMPVEEIFEGPALNNGFIKNEELAAASLRTTLYASDVINILMDMPGVVSVKNFVFARFDKDGFLVESQSWSLPVTPDHQPRLYIEGSKVLVLINGLPFLPDNNELIDTLQVIKGRNFLSKFTLSDGDLPVPHGNYFDLQAWFHVQDSLPLTYGIGQEGLPASASTLRKAQVRQLSAYLLFYDQILVNYLAQLSHIKKLFAVDESVDQTYFSRFIQNNEINGLANLYNNLNESTLQGMVETRETFSDRRNRFLDHLLARFAETFNDYALMLYSYTGNKELADSELIGNKISFIRNFPEISRNRAKSFNYKDVSQVCSSENIAGLAKRIQLLLRVGDTNSTETNYSGQIFIVEHLLLRPRNRWTNFELYEERDSDGKFFEKRWRLRDAKSIYLSSSTRYYDEELHGAKLKAGLEIAAVVGHFADETRYQVRKGKKWFINLLNNSCEVIGYHQQHFKTKKEADDMVVRIIEFAKTSVLNDPLLNVCLPADCSNCCGEDDPYSFRVTVVLNGEEGLVNTGLEFRRFAEQTIRRETPAHLGVKVCWVSKEQLAEFQKVYCAWLALLAQPEPDTAALHHSLTDMLSVFRQLKNVYPRATLFDCKEGNKESRVILGKTSVIGNK